MGVGQGAACHYLSRATLTCTGVSPDKAARLAPSCKHSTIERRAAHPGYKEALLERED
jgi:hypothetical protein